MAEFALTAPLLFLVLFSMVDGGLLLYSMNAVDNAATVGSNSVAAMGKTSTADTASITKMITAGFGNSGLVTPVEVDVAKLAPDTTNGGFLKNTDGTPKVDTSCSGQCLNSYAVSMPGGVPTVTAINSTPWAPSSRNVTNGSSDFAELVVKYQYHHIFGFLPTLTLSATKVFRLEPQQ